MINPRAKAAYSPTRGLVLAISIAIAFLGILLSAQPSHAVFVGNNLTAAPDSWGVNAITTQRRNPDASGTAYTGFAVGGVLTWMSVKTQGTAGTVDVYVLRKTTAPTPATQNFLSLAPVTSIAVPEYLPGAGTITTVPTRISVQPGDQFGASAPVDGTRFLDWHLASEATGYCFKKSDPHAAGAVATYDSTFCNNYIPLVRGYVEADADGDGYGDESQDLCATDPTISQQDCGSEGALANLKLSVAKVRTSSRLRSTITFRVENTGEIAAAFAFAAKSSRKLRTQRIVGGCEPLRNKRSCPREMLAPGSAKTIRLLVTGKRRGKVAVTAVLTTGSSESSTRDNSARANPRLKR